MLLAPVVGFGGVLNVEKENLMARQYNLLRLYSWNIELSTPFPTKEAANTYAEESRLDCVQISWEEVEE